MLNTTAVLNYQRTLIKNIDGLHKDAPQLAGHIPTHP
ncbi:hypothetical protein HAL1_17951 [Halomonas sp. HAL1]|nr:hypothetical protein HAL1_17951 [Halomonas sp. HAL1]